MTDVLSTLHAANDTALAEKLAKALTAEGFSVAAPGSLPPSLDTAKCVIVIWTNASTGAAGTDIREIAAAAKARGALVQVMMQKTRLPQDFKDMPYIDLGGWRGSPKNVFFRDLVAACRAKMDGTDTPKAKGPVRRTLLRAGALMSVFGLGFAFFMNVISVQNQVCSVKWGQPGVSDVCGALGLGDKPKKKERLAWALIPPGDCDALREHVKDFKDGAYRDDAADMISARRITQQEVWTPDEKMLALMVLQDGPGAPGPESARMETLSRASAEADSLCKGFAVTTAYKFVSARPDIREWDCVQHPSGHLCGGLGEAICNVEIRSILETETCGADPE